MNIGINFSYKLIASRGIARFTENIISNFPKNNDNLYFFIPKGTKFNFEFLNQFKIYYIEIDCSNYFIFEHIKVPAMVKKYGIDVLINPANTVPMIKNTKWITVIHDVIPFKLKPKVFTKKWLVNIYMRMVMRKAIKKSSQLITVSEYSKSDIHSLGYKHNNINVVYNGFNHTNSQEKITKVKGLPKHYVFWLGGDGYNKNMEAIVQLLKRNKCKLGFVIVGVKKQENIKLLQEIGGHVYVDVSDSELEYIYINADIFLFPSIYEGFGIPVLEAMHYEVPFIVSSNTTSLPEVCGDACIFVDPLNIDQIENTIIDIRDNKVKSKVKNYKKQLTKFNWTSESKKFYKVVTE